jgi:hypothetical protein
MERRLEGLGATFGAKSYAALLLPLVEKDGELVPIDPFMWEEQIETMIVFLGCYMHQHADYLETQPTTRLRRWFTMVRDLKLAERGKTVEDLAPSGGGEHWEFEGEPGW